MSSSVARYPQRPFSEAAASIAETRSASTKKLGIDVAKTIDEVPDEVLIAQICANDEDALASLFRRYARAVRGVSYRVLRNSAEAEDMVQEVFILICQNCASFDQTKGSAKLWLFQIAYRRAISRRRYLTARHYYQGINLDDATGQHADPKSTLRNMEESIDIGLGNEGLSGVFSALSEDQQRTLRLFFIEGYTFDEIAAKLGHTRGNVKHHYFRGLERLRKALFGSKLPGERAV